MLALVSTLWTAMSGNRLVSYAFIGALAVGLIMVLFQYMKNSGAANERSRQLQDWLSFLQKEWKRRAETDAMSTEEARRRLRERWSAR